MHNCRVVNDGCKWLTWDRKGRRGGGVAMYVRECFVCLELTDRDNRAESSWVRIRVKASKADVMLQTTQPG